MPTYILIAIDGTDSKEWMKKDGSNSFTYRFHSDFNTAAENKILRHGADTFGGNVTQIMEDVKKVLAIRVKQLVPQIKDLADWALIADGHSTEVKDVFERSDIEFCLIGHSRGAAMVVDLAAQLPKPVRFLGLYDSVARSIHIKGGKIKNVLLTYHAIRDDDVSFMDISRWSFSHENQEIESDTYKPKRFKTSHGGVGGDVDTNPTGIFKDYSASLHHKMDPKYCLGLGIVGLIMRKPDIINGCLESNYEAIPTQALMQRAERMKSESARADQYIRQGAYWAGMPIK